MSFQKNNTKPEAEFAADPKFMTRAIELATMAIGHTAPNPYVGAVIVKDGRIIGEGYHRQYGDLHAERDALKRCTESPEGADIYVTLEPCCHYGKQPPCTEAIVEAGIKRVIIGSRDPNPLVSGKGTSFLREHGVEVIEDYMREECDSINYVFFHYITTGRPYVVMKYAMTLDGKIATVTGDSKWITSENARKKVHEDRNRYTGIMVGTGTVLADNPELTCRLENGVDPVRIICDTHLRTPLNSTLVETAADTRTIIATCISGTSVSTCPHQSSGTDITTNTSELNKTDCYTETVSHFYTEDIYKPYIEKGCEILCIPEKEGHIDLNELMLQLGRMGIDSILLEGGGTLNWSALNERIVNRVQAYIAPKLIGGEAAPAPIRGAGIKIMNDAITLKNSRVQVLGNDYMIEGEIEYVHRNN